MSNPLEILWTGKANIYEYKDVTDPETYQTNQELTTVYSDEPCRLSYKQESVVDINNGVPYVKQITVLFIRPDITIKEGSVIEVTQNGVTNKYKRASKPPIYSNHQEITLKLFEDNA